MASLLHFKLNSQTSTFKLNSYFILPSWLLLLLLLQLRPRSQTVPGLPCYPLSVAPHPPYGGTSHIAHWPRRRSFSIAPSTPVVLLWIE